MPAQAELKVLHWGLQVAEFHKWQRIFWSMDTKQVVDELTSAEDLGRWDSRFDFVVYAKFESVGLENHLECQVY